MAGSISNRDTFSFPILCQQVPGAWTKTVVFGVASPELEKAYIEAAQDLVRKGAVAITSNCGFTIKFQKAVLRALSVPVSMSSLLLLPYILSTTCGRMGILKFDSRPLTGDLLRMAGVARANCHSRH